VKIGLLSNYPERRRHFPGRGRITVNAQEKDSTTTYDALAGAMVVVLISLS
jgi:hypothetical protein